MYSRIVLITLLIFMAFFGLVHAQDDTEQSASRKNHFSLSVEGSLMFPQSISKRGFDRMPYGGNVLFAMQIGQRGMFVGLKAGLFHYDNRRLSYEEWDGNEVIEYQNGANFQFIPISLYVSYFPGLNLGYFEPYASLCLGSTGTLVYSFVRNLTYEETYDYSFEQSHYNFTYGMQIGTWIDVLFDNVFIDVNIGWTNGTRQSFYFRKDETIESLSPLDYFEKKTKPFSFINIGIGIVAYI